MTQLTTEMKQCLETNSFFCRCNYKQHHNPILQIYIAESLTADVAPSRLLLHFFYSCAGTFLIGNGGTCGPSILLLI